MFSRILANSSKFSQIHLDSFASSPIFSDSLVSFRSLPDFRGFSWIFSDFSRIVLDFSYRFGLTMFCRIFSEFGRILSASFGFLQNFPDSFWSPLIFFHYLVNTRESERIRKNPKKFSNSFWFFQTFSHSCIFSRICPEFARVLSVFFGSRIFSYSLGNFRSLSDVFVFFQILSNSFRISDFFIFSDTFSDSLEFFLPFWDSFGVFQTLSKIFVISRILSDSTKFCRIPHVLGFSGIFASSLGFFRSLSDYFRFFRILSNFFSLSLFFFRRLSDSLGSSQNFLEFYAILTKFDRNLPYSFGFQIFMYFLGFSRILSNLLRI